ncbi:hypothetical protein D6T63_18650 [Arthrobacter cheniae]|uniref:Uncharacterized protein n=1 Tax=Arthrobacter cheniae TaxID=1258888 RepID=A0A3A5M743_9MICC|nr:hypothetical protein [Arthrobacter cheniae]RJT74352.1 hypothetical protein D6T63_18650 [Arthrobacter cheniae]
MATDDTRSVDLSNASNPRALTEAEAGWFTGIAHGLKDGDAIHVPYTSGRMALIRVGETLGIVDLYGTEEAQDVAKPEQVAKSTRKAPTEAKLDDDTAALFRDRTARLTSGQSIVLPGGATIRKAVDGSLWMTA